MPLFYLRSLSFSFSRRSFIYIYGSIYAQSALPFAEREVNYSQEFALRLRAFFFDVSKKR